MRLHCGTLVGRERQGPAHATPRPCSVATGQEPGRQLALALDLDRPSGLDLEAPAPLLVDPLQEMKEKARALLREDPERALMLVRAWLSADLEKGAEQTNG